MGSAPASNAGSPPVTAIDGSASPEQRPTKSGFVRRHRRAATTVLGAVLVAGFVYYVVPQIADLGPTLKRLRGGDVWWLALGVLLEAVSIFGEIILFRGVFSRPRAPMGWRTSYDITLAGGAATKILATAGAGGIALTVWALRACGVPAAEVAVGRERRVSRPPCAPAWSCRLLCDHSRRGGAVEWSEIGFDAQAEDAGESGDGVTGEVENGA